MVLATITVPPDGLSPIRYRNHIVDEIHRLGLASQLATKQCAAFFSGPSKEVRDELDGIRHYVRISLVSNKELVGTIVEDLGASLISGTEAGKFLQAQDLNTYFTKPGNPFTAGLIGAALTDAKNQAHAIVWGGPSALFAARDFKHAATCVCGADRKRVFLQDEIKPLAENKYAQSINGILKGASEEMLHRVGLDAAFDMTCRSEINFVYALASAGKRPPDAYREGIRTRIAYYRMERTITPPAIKDLNKVQKLERSDIINDFGLENLYASEPEHWKKQVLPILPIIPRRVAPAP